MAAPSTPVRPTPARNEIHVDVPPASVFRVLADPNRFADWVVGAKRIREVEGSWPTPGATFHHTVGLGPFSLRDTTQVLECEPDRRLVLRARARPAGIAHVALDLRPEDGGTRVGIEEEPVSGPAARLRNPLLDFVTRVRNTKSLRRLKDLAERG